MTDWEPEETGAPRQNVTWQHMTAVMLVAVSALSGLSILGVTLGSFDSADLVEFAGVVITGFETR